MKFVRAYLDIPIHDETTAANISRWREVLLQASLRLASLLGLIALVVNTYVGRTFPGGQWWPGILYILAYGCVLFLAFARLAPKLRARLFVFGIAYGLALMTMILGGLSSSGRIYLFAFTTLAFLLINGRAGLVALGLSLLTMLALGWLSVSGVHHTPQPFSDADPGAWAVASAVFLLSVGLVLLALILLQREFAAIRRREQNVLRNLQLEREELEKHVAERTSTIERRTRQIVTGAEVARAASAEIDPNELLRRAVNLIQERFELYYVGAFLVDETGRYAVLQAGTGEPGRIMLEARHRLEIGGNSMIGRAISERQPRLALDVGAEAIRFNKPVLPDTRSEMALPLIARDRLLGALTIQSKQPEAFSPEDIVSLQSMTDLIAIALDNNRLVQETKKALDEVTTLHRRYLTQAWTAFAQAQAEAGQEPTYSYTKDSGLERGAPIQLPGVEEVVNDQRMAITTTDSGAVVTAPMKIRDQIIGALAVETGDPDHVWDEDQLALIEAAAEQTALAIENARLIEEAQTALAGARRLATREQAVNLISGKIRRLPNVDSVLTTALVELGKALGASKGAARLGAPWTGLPVVVDPRNHE
jgi:GAF domain-containing protein